MKKTLLIFSLSFLILSSCTPGKEPLDIAVIFPFTGSTAYMLPLKNGLDMAINEIDSQNLFNGRKVQMHFLDSASDPETAVKAFDKIEREIHPDIYLSLTSTVSTELSAKALQYKVPIICLIASDPQISLLNEYTFTYFQTAEEEVNALIPVILELEINEMGILFQNEEYGESLVREIRNHPEIQRIKMEEYPYNFLDPDISEFIPEIQNLDALFIVGYKNNNIYMLNELYKNNYHGIILGTSTCSTSDFWEMKEADRLFLATPAIYNPNYALIQNFSDEYTDLYNENISHYSAIGYDILFLITELLHDTEVINRAVIQEKLSGEFVFPGLFGNVIKSESKRSLGIPLYAAQIADNKLNYLTY